MGLPGPVGPMNGHVGPLKAVHLSSLEPGDVFCLAGDIANDGRRYVLIAHAESSAVVRRVIQAEQIEFTRSDGTPVDFEARREQTERFAAATRVVVR